MPRVWAPRHHPQGGRLRLPTPFHPQGQYLPPAQSRPCTQCKPHKQSKALRQTPHVAAGLRHPTPTHSHTTDTHRNSHKKKQRSNTNKQQQTNNSEQHPMNTRHTYFAASAPAAASATGAFFFLRRDRVATAPTSYVGLVAVNTTRASVRCAGKPAGIRPASVSSMTTASPLRPLEAISTCAYVAPGFRRRANAGSSALCLHSPPKTQQKRRRSARRTRHQRAAAPAQPTQSAPPPPLR